MADPTVEDGTNTLTFKTFEVASIRFKNEKAAIVQYPYGEGQEVIDVGMRSKFYTFGFILKKNGSRSTFGTGTAYEQLEDFETLFETSESTNEYHRKVTYIKPDSTDTETLYGKILSITADVVAGEDEVTVNGNFDFAIDDKAATF